MTAAEALYGYSAGLEVLPFEKRLSPLDTSDLSARILGASGKVAFLPLQLHDDANLVRFSQYTSVQEVVLDVVPQLADAGYLTVVKTHPGSKWRPQSRTAFALARAALQPWAESVVWLDSTTATYDNSRLMSIADLVVTVNSSVGFEALYFDKTVAVLGEAAYKPAGLFPDLGSVIAGSFDLDAYRNGIGLLRRFMLGGYLAADDVRTDPSAFHDILLTIDAAHRTHGADARAVAGAIYDSLSLARQHRARARMIGGDSVPGVGEFGAPSTAETPATQRATGASGQEHPAVARAAQRTIGTMRPTDITALRAALAGTFADRRSAEHFVRTIGIVDDEFYLATYGDVARAGKDPVAHWTRHGINEGRKPRAGLVFTSVGELIDVLCRACEPVLAGNDRGALDRFSQAERRRRLDDVRAAIETGSKKVAVVAHLYYRDLVPEILESLANIPEPFDLIVTMPDWGNKTIVECVRARFPRAIFYPASNRGRDIGPFTDVLPLLIDCGYDAVLHLQTKAGYFHAGRLRRDLGQVWRREALEALLGSRERVADILGMLRADPTVREIGPEPHYLSLSQYPYHDDGDLAGTLLGQAPADGFFAGTMFWARPDVFRPLVGEEGLSLESFAEETGVNDGALAHLVERMFGHAALRDGGRILGAPVDPAAPLVSSLHPLSTTIHKHLETALAARLECQHSERRGSLMWT
ncbi:MAG: rhamnan synthesis F family protein [Microbacterium sp.]